MLAFIVLNERIEQICDFDTTNMQYHEMDPFYSRPR